LATKTPGQKSRRRPKKELAPNLEPANHKSTGGGKIAFSAHQLTHGGRPTGKQWRFLDVNTSASGQGNNMFHQTDTSRQRSGQVTLAHGHAAMLHGKRDYVGRILFSSDNATIDLAGGRVLTMVAGQPNHDNKRFREISEVRDQRLVAAYDEIADPTPVWRVTAGIRRKSSSASIEPHMIHCTDAAGEACAHKYDHRGLPGDELGDGPIARIRFYGPWLPRTSPGQEPRRMPTRDL
jgi:hypothetical protein